MPANLPVNNAVAVAHDIWSAFHAWLRILEDTLGGLSAGRTLRLHNASARQAADAAMDASPWRAELSEYLEAFELASDFVETWTDVGEPPRGTGGAYAWASIQDARKALEGLAGFLFEQLRVLTRLA